MKNLVLSVAVLAILFGATSSAFAQSNMLVVSDHPIYNEYGKIVGYVPNAEWERAKLEAFSRLDPNQNLPRLAPGQKIVDENGVEDYCPWFYFMGCVDLSGTPEYKAAMKKLAKDLIANGTASHYKNLAGWVKAVQQ